MNLKNMRECDNSKIHISNNSLLSICLLMMLDTSCIIEFFLKYGDKTIHTAVQII